MKNEKLNKNRKDDPPAFLGVFHLTPFATSCNALFSRKKVYTLGHFLGFLIFNPRPAGGGV